MEKQTCKAILFFMIICLLATLFYRTEGGRDAPNAAVAAAAWNEDKGEVINPQLWFGHGIGHLWPWGKGGGHGGQGSWWPWGGWGHWGHGGGGGGWGHGGDGRGWGNLGHGGQKVQDRQFKDIGVNVATNDDTDWQYYRHDVIAINRYELQ